jgi:hypothetical protein
MREQFQRALSELTASPDLVRRVRSDHGVLLDLYDLTDLEWRRLAVIVEQPGMECNCILYKSNRLAPIAINLPDLCKELDGDLRALLSDYWAENAQLSTNFWVESYEFCEFVRRRILNGSVSPDVLATLEREQEISLSYLRQIYPEKYESVTNHS